MQSIKSFQLLPCACELKWDIYFQKSPYTDSPLIPYITARFFSDYRILLFHRTYPNIIWKRIH